MIGADIRVLVADEVAAMRDMMRTLLRSLNHTNVAEAADGRQVLGAFENGPPHVAFIDVALRNPSGIAVLRRVRRDFPATFVVMVSGGRLAADLETAVNNGADAFLVKPYRLSKVQHALGKFNEISPRVRPIYSGVA